MSPLLAEDFLPLDFRGDPLTYTVYWEFTNDPGSGDIWPDPYVGCFLNRFDLEANPNIEYVYLDLPPFTSIDEEVIDTWSTDEPVASEQKSWGEVKSLFR